MKIGVIIQARMGSSRLPGKVMKKLKEKTILKHVINRVKQSNLIDEIIIATTNSDQDSVIELEALSCGVKSFRGSEDDVLSRYYNSAKKYKLDVIVRITSDCPLIDPKVMDEIIHSFLHNKYDIVSNAGSDLSKRSYPRGLDTEVFSFSILDQAYFKAIEKYQREHVTPYIYESSTNIYYYKNDIDYSKYRWTLDTDEDFKLISMIYDELYNGVHDFYLEDILNLFEHNPELLNINSHIEQKKLK